MPNEKSNTCGTCLHWQRLEDDPDLSHRQGYGICRAIPPDEDGYTQEGVIAKAADCDGCGAGHLRTLPGFGCVLWRLHPPRKVRFYNGRVEAVCHGCNKTSRSDSPKGWTRDPLTLLWTCKDCSSLGSELGGT